MRSQLDAEGFGDAIVQNFGSSEEVLIRIAPREGVKSELLGDKIVETLQSADPTVVKRRIEFVGPSVGEELTEQVIGNVVRVALHFGLCINAF